LAVGCGHGVRVDYGLHVDPFLEEGGSRRVLEILEGGILEIRRLPPPGPTAGAANCCSEAVVPPAIRVLRVAKLGAPKDRARALKRLRRLGSTAPEQLRTQLRGLSTFRLVNKVTGFRPAERTDVVNATKIAMRTLARRVVDLDGEIA
jgi:hypothetical protein